MSEPDKRYPIAMIKTLCLSLLLASGARAESLVSDFDASLRSAAAQAAEAKAASEDSLLARLIDGWRSLLAGYPFNRLEWEGGVDTLRHEVVRTGRCRFEVATAVETEGGGYLVAKRDARIDFRAAGKAELILRPDAGDVLGVALKLEKNIPVREATSEGDTVTVYRQALEWTGGLRERPAPDKMQELVFVLNGIRRACARPGPEPS